MLARLGQYPTYQVFVALVLAIVVTAVLFPFWMRLLRVRNIGQQVRADGPQGHLIKQGTPTMGGVLILLVVGIIVLLMVPAQGGGLLDKGGERSSMLALGVMLACGALGFIDDWSKVSHERSLGLRPRAKLFWQGLISVAFCLLAVNWAGVPTWLQVPLTDTRIDMGALASTFTLGAETVLVPWLYLLLVFIMIVGTSNAVNLTDGLDGLAAGTVTIVTLAYAGIAFRLDALPISLLAAAMGGACVGFLWYNSHPADIFMGDTGSLGLGGAIAALAVVTKTELLLIVIGGIYVIETLSVIMQVASFKLTGRRVLRMAPIHHHFEMLGWSETKVMVRFWIVTGVLAGLGFALFFVQSVRFKG